MINTQREQPKDTNTEKSIQNKITRHKKRPKKKVKTTNTFHSYKTDLF